MKRDFLAAVYDGRNLTLLLKAKKTDYAVFFYSLFKNFCMLDNKD